MPHGHSIGGLAWPRDDVDTAFMQWVEDIKPSPSTAWYSVWVLLNIDFHMLFLDDVYAVDGGNPVFRHLRPPDGPWRV